MHAPELHRSALVEEQAEQAPPPPPHVVVLGVLQVAPTQQPLGQVALHPVQTLFTQFSVAPHEPQVEPPVPHAEGEVPARQVVPEQQPDGHDVPLHTQAPLTHA